MGLFSREKRSPSPHPTASHSNQPIPSLAFGLRLAHEAATGAVVPDRNAVLSMCTDGGEGGVAEGFGVPSNAGVGAAGNGSDRLHMRYNGTASAGSAHANANEGRNGMSSDTSRSGAVSASASATSPTFASSASASSSSNFRDAGRNTTLAPPSQVQQQQQSRSWPGTRAVSPDVSLHGSTSSGSSENKTRANTEKLGNDNNHNNANKKKKKMSKKERAAEIEQERLQAFFSRNFPVRAHKLELDFAPTTTTDIDVAERERSNDDARRSRSNSLASSAAGAAAGNDGAVSRFSIGGMLALVDRAMDTEEEERMQRERMGGNPGFTFSLQRGNIFTAPLTSSSNTLSRSTSRNAPLSSPTHRHFPASAPTSRRPSATQETDDESAEVLMHDSKSKFNPGNSYIDLTYTPGLSHSSSSSFSSTSAQDKAGSYFPTTSSSSQSSSSAPLFSSLSSSSLSSKIQNARSANNNNKNGIPRHVSTGSNVSVESLATLRDEVVGSLSYARRAGEGPSSGVLSAFTTAERDRPAMDVGKGMERSEHSSNAIDRLLADSMEVTSAADSVVGRITTAGPGSAPSMVEKSSKVEPSPSSPTYAGSTTLTSTPSTNTKNSRFAILGNFSLSRSRTRSSPSDPSRLTSPSSLPTTTIDSNSPVLVKHPLPPLGTVPPPVPQRPLSPESSLRDPVGLFSHGGKVQGQGVARGDGGKDRTLSPSSSTSSNTRRDYSKDAKLYPISPTTTITNTTNTNTTSSSSSALSSAVSSYSKRPPKNGQQSFPAHHQHPLISGAPQHDLRQQHQQHPASARPASPLVSLQQQQQMQMQMTSSNNFAGEGTTSAASSGGSGNREGHRRKRSMSMPGAIVNPSSTFTHNNLPQPRHPHSQSHQQRGYQYQPQQRTVSQAVYHGRPMSPEYHRESSLMRSQQELVKQQQQTQNQNQKDQLTSQQDAASYLPTSSRRDKDQLQVRSTTHLEGHAGKDTSSSSRRIRSDSDASCLDPLLINSGPKNHSNYDRIASPAMAISSGPNLQARNTRSNNLEARAPRLDARLRSRSPSPQPGATSSASAAAVSSVAAIGPPPRSPLPRPPTVLDSPPRTASLYSNAARSPNPNQGQWTNGQTQPSQSTPNHHYHQQQQEQQPSSQQLKKQESKSSLASGLTSSSSITRPSTGSSSTMSWSNGYYNYGTPSLSMDGSHETGNTSADDEHEEVGEEDEELVSPGGGGGAHGSPTNSVGRFKWQRKGRTGAGGVATKERILEDEGEDEEDIERRGWAITADPDDSIEQDGYGHEVSQEHRKRISYTIPINREARSVGAGAQQGGGRTGGHQAGYVGLGLASDLRRRMQ